MKSAIGTTILMLAAIAGLANMLFIGDGVALMASMAAGMFGATLITGSSRSGEWSKIEKYSRGER